MAIKSLLFIFFLVCSTLFADNDSSAEFRGEAKAKLSFLEKQNVEFKIKLESLEDKQKSVEEYKAIIDRQDKRVEDVNAKMSTAGVIISFLAVIIGIGGVIFPILLFRQNTKAQEEAKTKIELWKEQTKKEFDEALEKFKDHAITKAEEITEDAKKIHDLVEKTSDISKLNNTISPEEQELASKESQILATEAKKTSSWKNYITSAKLSYFAKNYGDALRNIDEALVEFEKLFKKDNLDISIQEQMTQAFFIKGITFGELNESDKAIEVYEELDRRFKDNKNDAIQEYVAKALFNKGVTLGRLNESDKAIEVYEDLYRRFKDNKNDAIQEQVAKALVNKGITLGELNESAKAIEVYEDLYRRFKDNKNDVIQEQVADTLFNLFELQLIENQEWNMDMVNWCLEYGKSNKQAHLEFEMLEIIKEALTVDQISTIETLKQAFKDTNFGSWSWKELDTWAEKIEDNEAKKRVQQTIEAFKNWNQKE